MSLRTVTLPYSDPHAMNELIARLVADGRQFDVAPYPADLHTPVRTGWTVSFPAEPPLDMGERKEVA